MKLFILFLIIIILLCALTSSKREHFTTKLWKKNQSCNYKINETLELSLRRNSINETKDDNFDIYIPCSYNDIYKEINDIKKISPLRKYHIIYNADEISSKDKLWKNISSYYGREFAKKLYPNTYVLNNDLDMDLLKKEYNKNNIYILKKNIQRQEGLEITNNIEYIMNAHKKDFVIVQELLQNPYLLNSRKINLRIYLLVVCNDEVHTYIHEEGFMYYTKENFSLSLETGPNITTGYIDRKVYETNPLTLGDFRKYLDSDRTLTIPEQNIVNKGDSISFHVFNNIKETIKLALLSINLCPSSKLSNATSYQLFGVDIAINNNLEAMIMEINKGPDISCKDDRDCSIKEKVSDDILRVIGVVDSDHNFIKLF